MKRAKLVLSGFIAVMAVVYSFSCWAAFKIPASPQNYVSDYAGLLSSSQKNHLAALLTNYEAKTTNQIFVAIFKSLGGENLEDLSIRISERWKLGQKDKDNGVLLLVFLNDRKARIEVGYGLEPVLTDALAQAIIINEIAPRFKKGDYYSGIQSAVSQMIKIISGDFSQDQMRQYVHRSRGSGANPVVSLLFLIIFIILFIRHPFLALFLFSGGFSSGGRYSGTGGFSGGGGGSIGGGGASGGW